MMAPPKPSGDEPSKQPTGKKPQIEPSGAKPKKDDEQLRICEDPTCSISFTPWYKHTRCFRQAQCSTLMEDTTPFFVYYATIYEALEDPNNQEKIWTLLEYMFDLWDEYIRGYKHFLFNKGHYNLSWTSVYPSFSPIGSNYETNGNYSLDFT